MVVSDVSIKRPVFATVISLMLIVLGMASFLKLPVREYPMIDAPIISVGTVYKGASNEVIESRVTEVIESAVSGIEGVKQITSNSREERSNVNIEFYIDRDIDAAAADVRDKVSRVANRLPDGADPPVIAKVDSDARAILWFTLASQRLSPLELTDFAQRNIVERLSTLPGVASVTIGGERRYAMRIWLDRQAMAARRITTQDVEDQIKKQNVDLPSGRLESTQREFVIKTDSRMRNPDQFRNVIVAVRDGYQVKLGEIARVELGAEDERSEFRANGQVNIGIGIVRQSTANTLQVAEAAKAEMAALREALPEGTSIQLGYDESVFIAQSIYEVYHALGIAIALVIGVIFFFLRSWRATLIPTLAIPVSIIATFTVMGALGFSINVLTLLAMVLAIGIVVDDAIVVLENIHRRIEEGEPPLLASIRGARQITFAVLAATLTLFSVFVPISFMDGETGRLFGEFGIALAASVLFSGLVALTLSPMLCSKLLKPHSEDGLLVKLTEPIFVALNNGYAWLLRRALAAPVVVLAIGIAVSLAAVQLHKLLPKEFAPVEDRGIIIVPVTAPEGATVAYTREQVMAVERILMPFVESGVGTMVQSIVVSGFQRPAPANNGLAFLRMKPWKERSVSQQDIVRQIFPRIAGLPGARASAVNPPSLGQRGFQPPVRVVLGGSDYATIQGWTDRLMQFMAGEGRFLNLDSNFNPNKPELRVAIDRAKAADLGVPIETIGRTLEAMFGEREVSQFNDRGEEYKVLMRARAEDRATPQDLANIYVRSASSGQLIPLSNLVSVRETGGPAELPRVDRLRSITVSAQLVPGYALGDALDVVETWVKQNLPAEARLGWAGQSRSYKETANTLMITFGLALLIVFLVLAAQFESFIHPFVIMLAVPLAVTGGMVGLWVYGYTLNVYSQIGMILLIGLMTKNGILIVEFANQLRDEGKSIRDAVYESAVIRLRPILMTAIATTFGAVPLMLASGAGAESRSAIGVVVVFGVCLSTVLTGFVVPALYLLLARFTKSVNHVERMLKQMEAPKPAAGAGEVPHPVVAAE